MVVVGDAHQALATGITIGKRFKSARVARVADGNDVHLGHHHRADGRWRIYAFADAALPGEPSALTDWAQWMSDSPDSPLATYTPDDVDPDSVLDVKVVYQQRHGGVDLGRVPRLFLPQVGPLGLTDYEKVYAALLDEDIFDLRAVDRLSGCVVVVRPDQYVAAVLPLTATDELAAFFSQVFLPIGVPASAR
jgi:phenol 2-monooxygenase